MTYNQLTTEKFIERAKKVHGDKYDYSKVKYTNSREKVCIICPTHGEFWQTPSSHLQGRGCNLCSKPVYNNESFIIEANKVYGNKYDYSKVNYINSHSKVTVICPLHKEFLVSPNNHLKGRGCPKCGREIQQKENKKRVEKASIEFITKAKKIHGDKYDYSKVEYINNHTKVCIICPEHGEFWQTPAKHLIGRGCIKCSESKLERMVRVMLEENGIETIQECDYNTFKWLKRQRLDFYIPKYNVAIECQGEQHYSPVSFGCLSKAVVRERFKNILKYDKIKKEECEKNNIRLLYFTTEKLKKNNEFTNLKELLTEIKKNK